ncbi:MAG: opioid growth factor receptor-related protein [Flavisolibacter sp.]
MSSPIVEYYKGQAPDSEGRMLGEVQGWNFDRLERVHDYIQWLFPLNEPSSANPKAPILTESDIHAFQHSTLIRESLLASFRVLLSFYGLELMQTEAGIGINRKTSFKERSGTWLRNNNHNYLRITRILKCLQIAGLEAYARAFFLVLQNIYQSPDGKLIGARTFRYWNDAMTK